MRAQTLLICGLLILSRALVAQVHYFEDGRPWNARADEGPDKEVSGWYYNLGLTGMRIELEAAAPKAMRVRHVFAGSPAPRLPGSPAPRLPGRSGRTTCLENRGRRSMLTGQGALAFAMMRSCGIAVEEKRHRIAYDFLERATGPNGYVWYEDEVADPKGWADMGRTGAAGIACALSPWPDASFRERALRHARCIGEHPKSFPDTHGSPLMGMGFAALAASRHAPSFRRLLDENRYWFTLAQCADGTFAYQSNRDNAGYGSRARVRATAVAAFILSMREKTLLLFGKAPRSGG